MRCSGDSCLLPLSPVMGSNAKHRKQRGLCVFIVYQPDSVGHGPTSDSARDLGKRWALSCSLLPRHNLSLPTERDLGDFPNENEVVAKAGLGNASLTGRIRIGFRRGFFLLTSS